MIFSSITTVAARAIFVALFAFGMSACGSDRTYRAAEYRYEFTETGRCTTGVHNYGNLEAMCSSLQSASNNNNCAEDRRIQFYNSQCASTGRYFVRSY